MAGLIRNLSMSKARSPALPLFPKQDMELTPYYSNANSEGAYIYLPGFAGGTAGRSIRILVNSSTSFGATLYNIDGGASTDGVWSGGMTIAEGAGSSNADRFVGCYMDEADQVLYMLFLID